MFGFALRNLISRPLRTSLSTLGLAVAIAGMVGLFSIAGGLDSVVRSTFNQVPGLLVQQKGAPIPLFSSLPASWEQDLRHVPGVRAVEPQVYARVNQLDGKAVINPPRIAVGLGLEGHLKLKQSVYRDNLVAGRFLNLEDQLSNRCLVSREIAEGLQKELHDRFELNGTDFEIVGIYQTGSLLLDVNILMDINTCRKLARISPATVASFYVESDGSLSDQELKQAILQEFENRVSSDHDTEPDETAPPGKNPLAELIRGLDRRWRGTEDEANSQVAQDTGFSASLFSSSSSQIEVRTASDWGERFDEFSGDLQLFLTIMTAIGVSIATLSIVNTMMMSVTERTTEFGILRANGWSKSNIIHLMTIESGLIGFAGGVAGAAFGWLGTLVVNVIWPDRLQLHAGLGLLFFSVFFSIALGLIGGLYPAWSAARLSPMQSIRRGAS